MALNQCAEIDNCHRPQLTGDDLKAARKAHKASVKEEKAAKRKEKVSATYDPRLRVLAKRGVRGLRQALSNRLQPARSLRQPLSGGAGVHRRSAVRTQVSRFQLVEQIQSCEFCCLRALRRVLGAFQIPKHLKKKKVKSTSGKK